MTDAGRLASLVVRASHEAISEGAVQQLKIRILDSLGCAIGALGGELIGMVRAQVDEMGGTERCTLIGGGRTAPDRAAFFNGALVRYLDFNDSYLAKGETCHPSDNLAPVLAAVEYAGGSGQDLLTALAVAYQVQCRLSDEAPVRARGFDHTTQGAYAVAAGVAKALGLDQEKTINAIAISGTAFNALRVVRTGALSHWKGLAYPNTAFGATHAAFLAMRGVTGPRQVFEGSKGFKETIAGPFYVDWEAEKLERVKLTVIKKYNAEMHAQSAIEGILELREQHGLTGDDIEAIEVTIFDVAYDIIGGGEGGDKSTVATKEEADHSLPYLMAVALLDGQVMPAQYRSARIRAHDVQTLMKRVSVRPSWAYSNRFPDAMACRVEVKRRGHEAVAVEKQDYEGFHTRPISWEGAVAKFDSLAAPYAHAALRAEIVDGVAKLERIRVSDLTELLGQVNRHKGS
jgi:2-methylcitrate dehydratase